MNGEPTSLVGLLDQLVEAPELAPVPLTPQTWGWAVVAAILLAVVAALAVRWLLRFRADAYRRAALAELDRAGDDPAAVAAILRRTALAAYPRRDVAGLHGSAWLAFLDAHGPRVSAGPGAAIATAAYRRPPAPAPELTALARAWIRGHRRQDVAEAGAPRRLTRGSIRRHARAR